MRTGMLLRPMRPPRPGRLGLVALAHALSGACWVSPTVSGCTDNYNAQHGGPPDRCDEGCAGWQQCNTGTGNCDRKAECMFFASANDMNGERNHGGDNICDRWHTNNHNYCGVISARRSGCCCEDAGVGRIQYAWGQGYLICNGQLIRSGAYTATGPSPTTPYPTTAVPTTAPPTTDTPTTATPTTSAPTTAAPTTPVPSASPSIGPTASAPSQSPVHSAPSVAPTTTLPTMSPATSAPTTAPTAAPTSSGPTAAPTTLAPTVAPTTAPTPIYGRDLYGNPIFPTDGNGDEYLITDPWGQEIVPTDWAGDPVRPSTTTTATIALVTIAPDSRAAGAEADEDGVGGFLYVVIIAAIMLLLTIAGAVLFVRSKLATPGPATYSGSFVNQFYEASGPAQQRGAAVANWQVNAAYADPQQMPAAGDRAVVANPTYVAAAAPMLYADVAPAGESFGFGLDDDLEEEL